jgi:hypothetical protein
MAEDWKLQVSIRTSANRDSDMINVRANTVEELSVLLEGISDYSTQVAATAKMVQGAYNVSPLATTTSTPVQQASPTFVTAPTAEASGTTPTCLHGERKFLSGISKKNGKPYRMWVCQQPQDQGQCTPVNG